MPGTERVTRSARPGSAREARLERELFARYAVTRDPRDREALVERYLPLARSLALRYQRSSETLEDLFQIACLGLVKAADGFDPQRGIAFSSYAVPTILGELKRHFRDRTWAVRVPRGLQERSLRVDRAIDELAERLQRQPLVSEVAAEIGAEEESVLEALQAGGAQHTISFDAPRGAAEEHPITLGDAIGTPEAGFERAEDRATTDALMRILTRRERHILHLRFVCELTQAETGAVVGLSQMQVSRIIRQAIARMHVVATHEAAQLVLD